MRSPIPVEDLQRVVKWKLRRWQGNPEYDDILAQGYHDAWKAYRDARERGHAAPMAIAIGAVARSPANWLRKWIGRPGACCAERLAGTVSLEGLIGETQDEDESPLLPRDESFEAGLIQRHYRDWLWKQMQQVCTARQAEIVGLLLSGETAASAGERLGITKWTVQEAYCRAIQRCREALK